MTHGFAAAAAVTVRQSSALAARANSAHNTHMRIHTLLLAGLLCAAMAGPSSAKEAKPVKPVLVDRVIAVINNDIILLRDLQHRAARMKAAMGKRKMDAKELTKRSLAELINDKLILNVAYRLRIRASKKDIDAAIVQLKKANKINDTQLAHALQAQGYTMARYRQELALQIVRMRTINVAVKPRMQISESDLRKEYKLLVKKLGKAAVKPYPQLRKTLHERMFQRDILKYTQMWLGELRAMAYISVRL